MHDSHIISVFEHERLRVGDRGFHARHWELLARWAERQHHHYLEVWGNSVRFLQWVGVIEIEGLLIEVLPKADRGRSDAEPRELARKWRRILIALLGIAGYMDIRALDDAKLQKQQSTLLDVLFQQFVDSVEQLIAQGLVKRYRNVPRDRTSIKGRIDHAANLRRNLVHAERTSTVASEYDRLNRPNMILKAGIEVSSGFAPSAYTRNRARSVRLEFVDWPTKPIGPADFDLVRFDRKTFGYRKAIDLARLILARQSIDLSAGSERVFSLLFDMNELWQAAMLSRLRRDCARVGAENPEAQRYRVFWRSNDGTARKHIQPDIVVPAGRDPPTIVDTKWKVLASPTPGDEDLRQIFAYNALWHSTRGILLYPRVPGLSSQVGAYTVPIDGTARHCNVAFASPDPLDWPAEDLMAELGLTGPNLAGGMRTR